MGRIADTSSNKNYHQLKVVCDDWINQAKQEGFTHYYWWVNSDESWLYFATNSARAVQGAIELVSKEENKTIKEVREWYGNGWLGDFVTIDELDNL